MCDYWKYLKGSENLPTHLCPTFSRIEKPTIRKISGRKCQVCINEARAAARPPSYSLDSAKWAGAIAYCDTNGGATVSYETGDILHAPAFTGFMVGGVVRNNNSIPRWSRDKSMITNQTTALDIESFVRRPEHQLAFKSSLETLTLGLWISTTKDKRGREVLDSDGNTIERLYIDISEAFRSQYRAIAMAIARRELGIYMITPDYRNNICLDTSPTSPTGQALRAAVFRENKQITSSTDRMPSSPLRSARSADSQHEKLLGSAECNSNGETQTNAKGWWRDSPHGGFDDGEKAWDEAI